MSSFAGKGLALVTTWVDDLQIWGSAAERRATVGELETRFPLKNIEPEQHPHWRRHDLLGIYCWLHVRGAALVLEQNAYTAGVVERLCFTDTNNSPCPYSPNTAPFAKKTQLTALAAGGVNVPSDKIQVTKSEETAADVELRQCAAGAVQWIAKIRHDVVYGLGIFARGEVDVRAGLRALMRYLRTPRALVFLPDPEAVGAPSISVATDANFDTGPCLLGTVLRFCGNAVKTVPTRTQGTPGHVVEAEIDAAAGDADERTGGGLAADLYGADHGSACLEGYGRLAEESSLLAPKKAQHVVDSRAAKRFAEAHAIPTKLRHVNNKSLRWREAATRWRDTSIEYITGTVSSRENDANSMTKGLPAAEHGRSARRLGIYTEQELIEILPEAAEIFEHAGQAGKNPTGD